MASLDFDYEKKKFEDYYNTNLKELESARKTFITLISSIAKECGFTGVVVTGRVKDLSGCINKFNLKYRSSLESNNTPYDIKECITDLIGIRLVCLYEDEIDQIGNIFRSELKVLEETNKIEKIESTENAFGYKGLHLDLCLDDNRSKISGFKSFSGQRFELQIRTIVQDSWSTLDHKIKYKKSIPNSLKRRINTLAALFELADREFRYIREATDKEISKAEEEDVAEDEKINNTTSEEILEQSKTFAPLNSFRFLKIAKHFFNGYQFDPQKVDGFTSEILRLENNISRGKLNFYLKQNISLVHAYKDYMLSNSKVKEFNPYNEIRHCLYLANKEIYNSMLTSEAKSSLSAWMEGEGSSLVNESKNRRPRRPSTK